MNDVNKFKVNTKLKGPDGNIRKSLVRNEKGFSKKWLLMLSEDIWIVRMFEDKTLDHCFAIDGSRRLILESSEKYPMVLCEAALCCCFDKSKNPYIAEVYEVMKKA